MVVPRHPERPGSVRVWLARLAVFLASLPPKAAIDEVVIRRFASSPLHS